MTLPRHNFRGIWIQKALDSGWVPEYWDDADIDDLESLTLELERTSNLIELAKRRGRYLRSSSRRSEGGAWPAIRKRQSSTV